MEPVQQPIAPMLVVAAALIDAGGQVCLQQRPWTKRHGGLWEFPGGKVECGEDPGYALCREIAEELGVELSREDLMPAGFAASPDMVMLLYLCRRWQGEPRCLEGEAIAWVEPSVISTQAMPPLDYPLADQLNRVLAAGLI